MLFSVFFFIIICVSSKLGINGSIIVKLMLYGVFVRDDRLMDGENGFVMPSRKAPFTGSSLDFMLNEIAEDPHAPL
jgi:hypothetical protein